MKSLSKHIVITLCLLSGICYGRAPKVIKMIPENGATVKPGPCKIRILFDQDMGRGMSICEGPNSPEFIGTPKWSGKRAFIMNVNLEPNREYSFSINCPSAQNFKSIRGESAESLHVTFHTTGEDGKPQAEEALTPESNHAAVNALKEAIFNHYSYRNMKGLDWQKLFALHQKALFEAKNPKQFIEAAIQIVGEAKDKHLWFDANGRRIASYLNPSVPNMNFETVQKVVPGFKKQSSMVYSGRFNNGIGYIQINSWSSKHKEALNGFFVALYELSDTMGLIIDVRGNGGGDEGLARQVAGCFIEEPKMYAKNINIDPANPGQFTQVYERYVQPNKARPQYRGKVAVLIGSAVMSSCEAFVLMMKQVPGCVLIGETTQGSSGNPKPYDLGNGVTVYLPSWQAMLPDGTCFEGKGIKPDFVVKTQPDQLTKTDPVIKAAIKELASN